MTALARPPVITRRRVAWALGAAALPWALPGCGPIARPVTARMDSLREPADPARRAETLLVLLPGAYDTPQDFVREGSVQAVRERGLPHDLLLPDAHIGYYNGRLIVEGQIQSPGSVSFQTSDALRHTVTVQLFKNAAFKDAKGRNGYFAWYDEASV